MRGTYVSVLHILKYDCDDDYNCDEMIFGSVRAKCNHVIGHLGFLATETNSLSGLLLIDVFVHDMTPSYLNKS